MTDINDQEENLNDVPCQTIAEFLETTPPNQLVHISDLSLWRNLGKYPTTLRIGDLRNVINTPEIQLHCLQESCDGYRFFRCTHISSEGNCLEENFFRYFYVLYQCSNCQITVKSYALSAKVHKNGQPQGICHKFGELPPYGPHVPSKLIELIGPDRELFLQGHRCENQGFGIGAFAYYRRVVENQKKSNFNSDSQSCQEAWSNTGHH